MAGSDRKRKNRTDKHERGDQPDRESTEEHGHRLRGEEFASDFVDADADSCVVTHRRDDKESES